MQHLVTRYICIHPSYPICPWAVLSNYIPNPECSIYDGPPPSLFLLLETMQPLEDDTKPVSASISHLVRPPPMFWVSSLA